MPRYDILKLVQIQFGQSESEMILSLLIQEERVYNWRSPAMSRHSLAHVRLVSCLAEGSTDTSRQPWARLGLLDYDFHEGS